MYHPQTNRVLEIVHKEIRKFIFTEFFKNRGNFDIEEEIPREIKDLEDRDEIEIINDEILKSLSKLNKTYDIVDYNKSYVIDFNKIYISNGIIYKKKEKSKMKKNKSKFLLNSYVNVIINSPLIFN